MKVFHIITGLNDGGAEGALYRLCMHDSGNQHLVVSLMDGGKYGPLLELEGIPVTCLQMMRGRASFSAIWGLWMLIRNWQPDVVQTWMYHADFLGGTVAKMAGVRRVFWGIRNGTLESGKSRQSTILIASICSRISHFIPTRIICCADNAREVHVASGYCPSKMVVIPNGYDLSKFAINPDARQKLRQEWGISDRTFLVGMVARFDPQKDHFNLISALALLKQEGHDIHYVLAGTGMDSLNIELQEWLNDTDLAEQVQLLGPRSDIADVMNALDLHLLSSAYGEAFPNVLAEAMACGTPCVTTDTGDAPLIVGETGWVVPIRTPQVLAATILEAKNQWESDAAHWHMRRIASREQIEHAFDIKKMCAGYNAIWKG
jgi:glycosyltransferase involved in cell wall biosynthesis